MPLVERLLQTMADQIDPHLATDSDRDTEFINDALNFPENWVLKPQREGGGNNLYACDLREELERIRRGEKLDNSYTLMRKIVPGDSRNEVFDFVSKDGSTRHAPGVSEVGLFTVLFADGKKPPSLNSVGGVFCRAKDPQSNEGGVCVGHGYLGIPT
jgi:glutathione synthase